MKKRSIYPSVILLTLVFALGFNGSVSAAATPGLGQAASFGILSNTYTNTVSGTTLNGDLGYTTGPVVAATVNGALYVPPSSTYTQAGIDQGTALANLNAQPCTSIGAIVALDAYDVDGAGPLAPGTFPPGCYSSTGAMNITTGTTVTLSGTGTYVFRPGGALTSGANSVVSLAGGASACDIFWAPVAATTLGANSTFAGTDVDASGITIGNTVTWTGHALAFGGTVTTTRDTINVPSCTAAAPGSGAGTTGSSSTSSSASAVPGMPDTGFAPGGNSSIVWKVVTPAVALIAVTTLYLARKKWA
ncbi:MAG: hypothetical protein JWN38_985 [Candidatus Saccharibacteria bacterium]|nr:hypothetical protein [Candidatus Saccharibacteria bacterium]